LRLVTFADGPCECSSKFTDIPQNLAVVAGSDCVLKCAINDTRRLRWDKNHTKVYSGYDFAKPFKSTGRFEIIREKSGTYNLLIRRAQPSDAGEYECGRTNSMVASAQLVIIGKSSIQLETKLMTLSIFVLFRDMPVTFCYHAFY